MAPRISRLTAALLVTVLGAASLSAQPLSPGPGRPGPGPGATDHERPEKRSPGDKREGPPRRPLLSRNDPNRSFGPTFLGTPEFDRMLRLAFSSEDEVRAAMDRIPGLVEAGPEGRDRMLRRLEGFRRMLKDQALREAEELGLTIPPEREQEFIRSYWQQRAAAERTLREEMEPRRRQLMERVEKELREAFGPP